MEEPNSMYRVLVPVSDNEASAQAQVRFVSELPGATTSVEALLTHVLHDEELTAPRESRTAQRIGTVVHARDYLRDRDVSLRVVEAENVDRPVEGIIGIADRYEVDLIVLGGGMHSLLDDLMDGHVVKSVGRASDRPIAVVVPGVEAPARQGN